VKIENRSALVISTLISKSILPKIIFVCAVVTAVAIFYESGAIGAGAHNPLWIQFFAFYTECHPTE